MPLPCFQALYIPKSLFLSLLLFTFRVVNREHNHFTWNPHLSLFLSPLSVLFLSPLSLKACVGAISPLEVAGGAKAFLGSAPLPRTTGTHWCSRIILPTVHLHVASKLIKMGYRKSNFRNLNLKTVIENSF